MLDMLKIGNIHIHYQHRVVGARKPTLVFINSLGTDFRIWSHCLCHFEDDHDILLYDKRGHGLSEANGDRSDIADHAGDLLGLADKLSVDKMILVGLSIGGLIAQTVHRKRPDRVTAMVLANTGMKVGDTQSWNERIDAVRTGGVVSIAEAILGRWFAASFETCCPDRFAAASAMLTGTSDAGYIAACTALRDADLTESAQDIAAPVLCIAGSEDQATPPELVHRMADTIPQSRLELLSGVGHISCLEDENAFGRSVRSFLQTCA